MPIHKRYNAIFKKPDGITIILTDYTSRDLLDTLETLLKDNYNIDFEFTKYGVYDLRMRRNRINKFIRNIIPECHICSN
jgi:hypothetical protein